MLPILRLELVMHTAMVLQRGRIIRDHREFPRCDVPLLIPRDVLGSPGITFGSLDHGIDISCTHRVTPKVLGLLMALHIRDDYCLLFFSSRGRGWLT